jgi:hypothetical protein
VTVRADAAAALTAAHHERGIEMDWHTGAPAYRWEDDIPAAIRDRAWEALDR